MPIFALLIFVQNVSHNLFSTHPYIVTNSLVFETSQIKGKKLLVH